MERAAAALIDAYRHREDASARRVLVTVFGDSVEPRGGCIWLGDLIDLVAPLGIGDRLVRTSVGRLVADGLLENTRVGRRSRYAVTTAARRDFRAAERRIYHPAHVEWDGSWTVLMATADLGADERAALRLRLGWQGFSEVAPGVLISPSAPSPDLDELIDHDEVVTLRATAEPGGDRRLLVASHELEPLAEAYQDLVDRYQPVADGAGGADGGVLSDGDAFVVRTLLVDDYRRVLLRDPGLPSSLLPRPWPGDAAAAMAARLYRVLDAGAERHLTRSCTGPDGDALPPRDPTLAPRFPPADVTV